MHSTSSLTLGQFDGIMLQGSDINHKAFGAKWAKYGAKRLAIFSSVRQSITGNREIGPACEDSLCIVTIVIFFFPVRF